MGYGFIAAADHHAVALGETPDAAAGSRVDVVHAACRKLLGPPDVVLEVGVAAVDHRVARPADRVEDTLGVPSGRGARPRPLELMKFCKKSSISECSFISSSYILYSSLLLRLIITFLDNAL